MYLRETSTTIAVHRRADPILVQSLRSRADPHLERFRRIPNCLIIAWETCISLGTRPGPILDGV